MEKYLITINNEHFKTNFCLKEKSAKKKFNRKHWKNVELYWKFGGRMTNFSFSFLVENFVDSACAFKFGSKLLTSENLERLSFPSIFLGCLKIVGRKTIDETGNWKNQKFDEFSWSFGGISLLMRFYWLFYKLNHNIFLLQNY